MGGAMYSGLSGVVSVCIGGIDRDVSLEPSTENICASSGFDRVARRVGVDVVRFLQCGDECLGFVDSRCVVFSASLPPFYHK
jgi:hypothetical protein